MIYSDVQDIEGEFKDITFDEDQVVTDVDVEDFITEADSLINSFVGQKYKLPIPDAAAGLPMLKMFSRTIVAARVRSILANKQATNVEANQDGKAAIGISVTDVMKMLKAIADGKQKIDGATPLDTAGGFSSFTQANAKTPVFKKDERQW